jgi:hypothetical protein
MKLPRRPFLHLAAGAAALPAVPRIAFAQAYPTRPVRIIVGFAPGGGVAGWPLAGAQRGERVRRVGILMHQGYRPAPFTIRPSVERRQ